MASLIDAVGSATLLMFAGSAVLAFVIAVVATPIVGRVATRLRLLDHPGGRRQHLRPIPRIGGLRHAVALCAALPTLWPPAPPTTHPVLLSPRVRHPPFPLTEPGARP